jgi:hypothetical protein
LRHSYASQLIISGVPMLVVANNPGDADTGMYERNCGHLHEDYQDAAIEAGAPKFGLVQANNVTT